MKLITEGMTAGEAIGWLDTMKQRGEPQRIEPACAHRDIRWAADGVDGVCKGCGETVVPRLKSLPPQSD